MIVNKVFRKLGETTTCADLDFMKQVHSELLLFSHRSPEIIQRDMIQLFEGNNRYEYSVRDDAGRLLALMVITADDYDYHIGEKCLVVEMACSFETGALSAAYRWIKQIARDEGFSWIRYTKTDGYTVTMKYKQLMKP